MLYDSGGNVLIAQRPPGLHMGGEWEFPGGKLDLDEQRFPGLVRELREELGVDVESARPLIRIQHDYPDRLIDLDVWTVRRYRGQPAGLEGQALRWVTPASLPEQGILAADRPVIAAINLGHKVVCAASAPRDECNLRPWLEKMTASGVDTVCIDTVAVRLHDSDNARLVATARACGVAVAKVTEHSRHGRFLLRDAELCGGSGLAFSLLSGVGDDGASAKPDDAELSAIISTLSRPVFVPAAWVGGALAAAWWLGAQGLVPDQ